MFDFVCLCVLFVREFVSYAALVEVPQISTLVASSVLYRADVYRDTGPSLLRSNPKDS